MKLCDQEISEDEVKQAIKTMKSGSTPGSDGIPAEFYKFESFLPHLVPILTKCFNFCVENQLLSPEMCVKESSL